MADTMYYESTAHKCEDCGTDHCEASHCGPLVPDSVWHSFCTECWSFRVEYYSIFRGPLPLRDPPTVEDNFC